MRAAPHDELLGEREVRPADERLRADGLGVLDAVHGDVEIAAHERWEGVAPVVLHEPLADPEPLRQPFGDEDLESFQLRRIARVAIDERLTALQVAAPGQLALGANAVDPAGESGDRSEGEKTDRDACALHESPCEGSRRATQYGRGRLGIEEPWMRHMYDLISEPRDAVWAKLLEALASISASVALVVRDGLGLGESGNALLQRLEPFLLERTGVSSWPGTTLFGHQATLVRFTGNAVVVRELAAASESLYGWTQPALPEDPSFARADGTTVFGSISHERDAFFEITEDEHRRLVTAVPSLATMMILHP